jgi:drug/metabolite transporter (DMT)-like permease
VRVVQPVATAILEFAFFGEVVGWTEVMGAVLIGAGLLLSSK